MPIYISMLRGINVGAHNRIKMDALCSLYESLKLEAPQTYVQSGNVIFRTKEKNTEKLATQIRQAIEKKLKCSPAVILRTTAEMKKAIAANPFSNRPDIVPGKLLLTFLATEPAADAKSVFEKFKDYPEEIHLKGRELYIYFPNGAGKSKLPWSQVEKLLKVTGTARNWNSVTKMLEIAEALEKG